MAQLIVGNLKFISSKMTSANLSVSFVECLAIYYDFECYRKTYVKKKGICIYIYKWMVYICLLSDGLC